MASEHSKPQASSKKSKKSAQKAAQKITQKAARESSQKGVPKVTPIPIPKPSVQHPAEDDTSSHHYTDSDLALSDSDNEAKLPIFDDAPTEPTTKGKAPAVHQPAEAGPSTALPTGVGLDDFDIYDDTQQPLRDPEEIKSTGFQHSNNAQFTTDNTPIMSAREAAALRDGLSGEPSNSATRSRNRSSNRSTASTVQDENLPLQPVQPDADFRLDIDDFEVEVSVARACGSGAAYRQVPTLTGADNWGDYTNKLHNAALAEQTEKLIRESGYMREPTRPDDNCSNRVWNRYIQQLALFQRKNNNLLSGIRSTCDTYYLNKINSIWNARDAYMMLQRECQQHGASSLGEIVSRLINDNLNHHKSVKDFSESFITHLETLQRMQLSWSIPDELLQLWFLASLGEAFSNFRSTIFLQYTIAGVGDGPALTLHELMTKAKDEWTRMQSEQRMAGGQPTSVFYQNQPRGTKRPGQFSSQQPAAKRLNSGAPNSRPQGVSRSANWKPKPPNYTGPHQMVCSWHGWLDGDSNHNDANCILQKRWALERSRGRAPGNTNTGTYHAEDFNPPIDDDTTAAATAHTDHPSDHDTENFFLRTPDWPDDLGNTFFADTNSTEGAYTTQSSRHTSFLL